jgi:hypothetical protein
MSVGYTQRALWPEFDEEEESAMANKSFVHDLLKALDVPEQFTENAEFCAFSDGSASVTLHFELTPEQVDYLHAIKQSHD